MKLSQIAIAIIIYFILNNQLIYAEKNITEYVVEMFSVLTHRKRNEKILLN